MTRCQLCLLLLLGLHGLVIQSKGASVSTTLSDDQTQGNNLKEIIENVITDDKCTQFMEQLAPDCSTLSSNVGSILNFCTQEDYNKLLAAICNKTPTSTPVQSSPSSTATTTSKIAPASAPSSSSNQVQDNPVLNSEQAQRDQIKQVMENEVSGMCSERAEGMVTDDTPLDQACDMLELLEGTMTMQGCTQQDYSKLHEVMCDYVSSSNSPLSAPTTEPTPTPSSSTTAPGTTPAPISSSAPSQAQSTPAFNNEQDQRDKIKEVIENELSSDRCKNLVAAQSSDDTPLDEACKKLEGFKAVVTIVGCTQDDYDKLHAVICDYVGSSALNSEQAQRDMIKEVIENELSSDRCKNLVAAQASDDTKPLDEACKQLEGFKAVVTVVGCTQDDYDKIHAVFCDYVGEQAQRDKIKQVIENKITPGMCREILGTLPDDTSLDTACVQLQTFADIVTTVGCTQDDYDKLRAVICDYVGLSDSESTVKPPITTASPTKTPVPITTAKQATNQGGPANDDKQRDVIKCVIENELSSDGCKAAVELQVDENIDLQAGCSLLESLHPAVSAVGCTEDDYTKLHQAICDYGKTCNGAKVKGFNLKKWQDYVLSVMDNQLTQQCATLPRSQATEDATPEKACEIFELGRSVLEDMCKENELQLLNEALCEYKNNTDKRILDETKVVIDTKLTSSCKTAISRQADVFSSNVSLSCTIVSQAGPGLIDNQQCTQADIDFLNNTVCYGDSFCDPPYTSICYSGEEIVKPSPRESRVRTVIGKLTGQCNIVMTNSFSQLSQEPPDACQTLEATRKDLIDGNVCTELDFVKLQQVVCMDVPLGTEVGTEDQIRENALFIMQNDLTKSCHNVFEPQTAVLTENLVKGCDLLQKAGATLVASGICTLEDYDKLEDAVCSAGKTVPVYNETERAQREHIEDVITHDVAEGCRTTMLPQIEAQKDKPLPESCENLNKNKNVIVTGGICTEDDFGKIQKAVCESGGSGSAATTTASYLATGPFDVVIQSNETSVSATLSEDQTQGHNLKEIIENLITDDKCTQFLEQLTLDGSTLTVSSNVDAILNFCTQEDYNKLRAVLCNNTPTPNPAQSPSPSSSTTTTTSNIAPAPAPSSSSNQVQDNLVLNSEQAQRDQIKQVMENEISGMCSERAEGMVTDDTSLFQSCDVLELLEGTITSQGCTQQEYNKLHEVICDYAGSLALNSEQAQRDDIKRVTENEISDSCSERVSGLAPDDKPLDQICDTLKIIKSTITHQGCTQQDYNKLHEVMCNYVNSSNSKSTVKSSTSAQTTTEPPTPKPTLSSSTTTPKATTAPTTNSPPTSNQGQTSTGITTAKQVTDQGLDEPIIQSNGASVSATLSNDQTQGNNLKELIENLITDDKCKQFLEQLTLDCSTLSGNVGAILNFCTREDYNKLHAAICNNTPTPNPGQSSSPSSSTTTTTSTLAPAPATSSSSNQFQDNPVLNSEQAQREKIKQVMENEISVNCNERVEGMVTDDTSLIKVCNMLESLEGTFTSQGCTQQEYNKLHEVICDYVSEQAQRDKIKEVIENELSSDHCKTLVVAGFTDDIKPLDAACTKLESFGSVFTVVGCTKDDYNKLHAVICDYVSEQAQRDKIKEVIENELSSDRCKGVLGAPFHDDTIPLDVACTKLESIASLVSIVGCTQDDYNKLHAVMCDYVGLFNSRSTLIQPTTTASPTTTTSPTTKTSPTTTASSTTLSSITTASLTKTSAPTTTAIIQGVPANDDKQREVIKCFFENELSSHQCKAAVELLVKEDMDLQAGCTLLESLEPAMPVVGCTEDDYTKLHQAICDYGKTCNGAKVKGFNLKKWQDFVLSVIDNQLTQQCATLPRSQATEDATPEKACEMFELSRSALEDMCTEDELQLLNEALCEYKKKTDKRILDKTKVVIDTKLTSSCKTAINRQADAFSSDVSQSCTIVSQAGPGLIDNQHCTQADIDVLNNTVCYGDSSCDPPYTGICYSGEEPSPRARRVRTVIGKLTGQCKNVMTNSFSQLSQAPPDACQTLEATRKDLIDGNVCTELDFVKLQQVVCMDVPLGTYDGAENEIRDNALFVIQNDLTVSCHNTFSPQAVWYAENRDKGCDVIQIAKRCTQEDYDKLDNALCTAG